MATLLHRIGLGAVRHRIAVVLTWLLVLVAAGVGAATLSGTTSNTFRIPGQESTTALDLLEKRFGAGANGATAQVTFEAPAGKKITQGQPAGVVTALAGKLASLPGVVSATNPLDARSPTVSADQQAAFSTVTYRTEASLVPGAHRDALLAAVADARGQGVSVEVTGEASQETGADVGGPGEIVGVVVALVVLALTYGSLVAAGMNLLTAIVGVAVGSLGITTLTGFVDLNSTTPILALMLGLAVGIDYALFIVTRFRHELAAGRDVPDAVALSVGTAGSAVVTAGVTVVIALSGLAVAGIPFLTEMGLAAAATIVLAVLVAITLVPATLGFLGHRALPRRDRHRAVPRSAGSAASPAGGDDTAGGSSVQAPAGAPAETSTGRSFYARWVRLAITRRWPALLGAVVALAVIAIPVFSMRTTLAQPAEAGTTQARATQVLDKHFGPGVSGPLLVLVDGQGAPERAATIAQQAPTLPGVALVTAPQLNPAKTAALVTVIPASGPSSQATVDLVHALRDRFQAGSDPAAYVTGSTAVSVDVSQRLGSALPIYLVLVVGLALVLLILVFRSILVPVTGVVGFLLTIGASLGAATAVFQWGWLKDVLDVTPGPLLSLAPIIVIGILFGLAMDYQVFLVSRMHEAHSRGSTPRDAVSVGFRQAAPVVVAAASIMFAVFAGFVPGGTTTIKLIAFALALGIVFDALVVRMIVMPAALAILGRAAWALPRWLRWLPALDVEGARLERRLPPAAVDAAPVPAEGEVSQLASVRAGQADGAAADGSSGSTPLHLDAVGGGSADGPVVWGRVLRPDGAPQPGAVLTLADLGGRQLARARTDADGGYRLSAPAENASLLICAAADFQPVASLITAAGADVRHDVRLTGAGRVGGTVSSRGGPLADASLTLTDARGNIVGVASTGADGGYLLGDVLAGDYTLTAAAERHQPTARTVQVPAAGLVRLDLELPGTGELVGMVRASGDHGPLPGATVTLLAADGSVVASGRTDAHGQFSLTDLAPGSYTFTAGYAPVAARVHLSSGHNRLGDVTLGPLSLQAVNGERQQDTAEPRSPSW